MKKLKRYDAKHNDMSHNMVYAKVNNRNLKYGVFSQNKSYFDSRPEEERALRLVSLYLPYNMPFGLKYPFVTDYEPIEPPLIRLSSEPSIQRLRRSSTPIEEIAVKSAKKPRFTEKKKPINYAKDYKADVIGAFTGPNKYVSSLKVMNNNSILGWLEDADGVAYENINDSQFGGGVPISMSIRNKSFNKVSTLKNKTMGSLSKITNNLSIIGSDTGEFNPVLTSAITYNVKDALEVSDYGGLASQEMDVSKIINIKDTGVAFMKFTSNELPQRVHEYEIKIKQYEENAKEVAEKHRKEMEKLFTQIRSQDTKINKLVKELAEKEKELLGMHKILEDNKKLKNKLEDELKGEMKYLKNLNAQYLKKIQELEEIVKQNEKRISRLEAENDKLRADLKEAKKDKEESQAKLKATTSALKKTKENLKNANLTITELKEELESSNTKIEELTGEMGAIADEKATIQKKYKAKIMELDEQIEDLVEVANKKKKKKKGDESEMSIIEDDDSFEGSGGSDKVKMVELYNYKEREMLEYSASMRRLAGQLAEKETQLYKTTIENKNDQTKIKELEEKLNKYEDQMKEYKEALSKQKKKNELLKQQTLKTTQKKEEEIQKCHILYIETQKKLAELTENLQDESNKAIDTKKAMGQIQELKAEKDELVEKTEKLEKEIKHANKKKEKEIQELHKELIKIAELGAMYGANEGIEKSNLKGLIEKIKAQKLESKAADLEKQKMIVALKAEKDTLKKSASLAEIELAKMGQDKSADLTKKLKAKYNAKLQKMVDEKNERYKALLEELKKLNLVDEDINLSDEESVDIENYGDDGDDDDGWFENAIGALKNLKPKQILGDRVNKQSFVKIVKNYNWPDEIKNIFAELSEKVEKNENRVDCINAFSKLVERANDYATTQAVNDIKVLRINYIAQFEDFGEWGNSKDNVDKLEKEQKEAQKERETLQKTIKEIEKSKEEMSKELAREKKKQENKIKELEEKLVELNILIDFNNRSIGSKDTSIQEKKEMQEKIKNIEKEIENLEKGKKAYTDAYAEVSIKLQKLEEDKKMLQIEKERMQLDYSQLNETIEKHKANIRLEEAKLVEEKNNRIKVQAELEKAQNSAEKCIHLIKEVLLKIDKSLNLDSLQPDDIIREFNNMKGFIVHKKSINQEIENIKKGELLERTRRQNIIEGNELDYQKVIKERGDLEKKVVEQTRIMNENNRKITNLNNNIILITAELATCKDEIAEMTNKKKKENDQHVMRVGAEIQSKGLSQKEIDRLKERNADLENANTELMGRVNLAELHVDIAKQAVLILSRLDAYTNEDIIASFGNFTSNNNEYMSATIKSLVDIKISSTSDRKREIADLQAKFEKQLSHKAMELQLERSKHMESEDSIASLNRLITEAHLSLIGVETGYTQDMKIKNIISKLKEITKENQELGHKLHVTSAELEKMINEKRNTNRELLMANNQISTSNDNTNQKLMLELDKITTSSNNMKCDLMLNRMLGSQCLSYDIIQTLTPEIEKVRRNIISKLRDMIISPGLKEELADIDDINTMFVLARIEFKNDPTALDTVKNIQVGGIKALENIIGQCNALQATHQNNIEKGNSIVKDDASDIIMGDADKKIEEIGKEQKKLLEAQVEDAVHETNAPANIISTLYMFIETVNSIKVINNKQLTNEFDKFIFEWLISVSEKLSGDFTFEEYNFNHYKIFILFQWIKEYIGGSILIPEYSQPEAEKPEKYEGEEDLYDAKTEDGEIDGDGKGADSVLFHDDDGFYHNDEAGRRPVDNEQAEKFLDKNAPSFKFEPYDPNNAHKYP